MVARLPHHNIDPMLQVRVPRIGATTYAGIGRLPWFDVRDEDYYRGVAPPDVARLLRRLADANTDVSGIDLWPDPADVRRLLAYADRASPRNEVVAVRSPGLFDLKAAVDVEAGRIEWLGWDAVPLGVGSLLPGGVYESPAYYADWVPRLNPHGLLPDPALVPAYATTYRRAVADGVSEPRSDAGDDEACDAVEVGRVLV
jgi:hypothetical protein